MIQANHNEDHFDATDEQYALILALLDRAIMDEDRKKHIEHTAYTALEADKMIQELSENQIDPIMSGSNYNMGDINRKLRNEI